MSKGWVDMSKDTFYFQHDYNARNDEKILNARSAFCNAEGYGMFWMLLESMAEGSDGSLDLQGMAPLALGYGLSVDRLEQFVEFCISIGLFQEVNGRFYSPRMQKHKEYRALLSEAGRAGARKRWSKDSHPITHPNSTPNAKERKGKERKYLKEFTSSQELIAFLKQDPLYNHIDVDHQFQKALDWVDKHPGSSLTKRFFINWLKKVEPPLAIDGAPALPRV